MKKIIQSPGKIRKSQSETIVSKALGTWHEEYGTKDLENDKKQLEEARDDKENNAFVLHAIVDKMFNKNHIKNLYVIRSLSNSFASLSSSRGKD